MSLLCNLGIHKPDLRSIVRKQNRLEALCEACACRIEKGDSGRWTAAAPLLERPPEREPNP